MKSSCPQNGGWCAYLNYGYGGQRICGFATLQQCLAEVRGVGGNCGPSLYYQRPYYQPYRRGYPIDRTIASTKVPAASRYSPQSAAPMQLLTFLTLAPESKRNVT